MLKARIPGPDSGDVAVPADAEFAKHLEECRGCREALEAGELAGVLLRETRNPEGGPGGFFAARVTARIVAEEQRHLAEADLWRPMEVLAKKLVWASALLLLVLSSVVYEMKPGRSTMARAQESVSDRFPEPVPQSADEDEVLVSLAERGR
ncbi:MAG TPA: hypothetical protein VEU31_05330 [Candidatus Acidoferrales bacterium]|nr:hypothetical protein [Candidatus Acidoferrales bacterium]